jgi:hypothetical protein
MSPKLNSKESMNCYEKLNGVNAAGNKVKWTDNKIAELEGLETKRDAPNYQTPLKHLCVKFGYKTRKV